MLIPPVAHSSNAETNITSGSNKISSEMDEEFCLLYSFQGFLIGRHLI